jgi:hypothetical protein
MTERCVFEDHRAGARDFAGHRESLNEAEHDQQRRCERSGLLVRRQESDGHGGRAHQEHAAHEHLLAAIGVSPVPENERAHRPGDIAHAVRRERGNDRDCRIVSWKEDLRKDE